MPVKEYPVLVDYSIDLQFYETSKDVKRYKIISWDERRTVINKIEAYFRVKPSGAYSYATLYINDQEVVGFWWEFGAPADPKEETVDITGLTINGTNRIRVEVGKGFLSAMPMSFTVSVSIFVDYAGIPPEMKTSYWDEFLEFIRSNWLLLVLIFTVIGSAGAVAHAYIKSGRKE